MFIKIIKFIKKRPAIFVIIISVVFFWQVFFRGLLPIPSDTIVGLYYPFRDIYAKEYPRGIPFKNFLITDPVRQTYPWKNLVITLEKKMELPLWNPYNFSGTPLLANFQSGAFYPGNIVFFILPFDYGWSFLIVVEPLFAGLFMFLYLNNLKLKREASLLGAISFSFSGFFIAWMEWGNILHTALWLPLILLCIDKLFQHLRSISNIKYQILNKWGLIFVLSLIFSFFAGHLQTFFYIFTISIAYIIFRWFEHGKKIRILLPFVINYLLFIILTSVQWVPTLQFILLSARGADLAGYSTPGWFIPWQNLIQFIIPDFFGNPTTLNYWGIWNYGEFIGYIGIFPLLMALLAIFGRRDKNVYFFTSVCLIALVLALPSPISKLPYFLHIPMLETAQPTRLVFLIVFSLSILAAFGFDMFEASRKKINILLALFAFIFLTLWIFVLQKGFGVVEPVNLSVIRQNLIFPSAVFGLVVLVFITYLIVTRTKKLKKYAALITILFLAISIFDLFRFGWKFEPFTKSEYLFPSSKIISFLQKNAGINRVMSADSQIFPPNFSAYYHIQTPDGYDPLYIKRYGQFVAAYSRNKPDISTPFGFNRIITLQNTDSRLIDFLGIKYVLTLSDSYDKTRFKEVLADGKVSVLQNHWANPRVFFVLHTEAVESQEKAINILFDEKYPLIEKAVVEKVSDPKLFNQKWVRGEVEVQNYSENKIILKTENKGDGFLVLTDAYYPTWKAKIDGHETEIFITDLAFRGIIVPKGIHTVEFYNTLY